MPIPKSFPSDASCAPAISNIPNEPVEVDEPVTPPPTSVIALELNSPLQEPLTLVLKVESEKSTLTVTLPDEPPPLIPVPAVTPVTPPASVEAILDCIDDEKSE